MNSKFMQMKAFPEKETSRDILQKPVLRAQDSRSFFYFLTILHLWEKGIFSFENVYELQIAARIPNIFVRTW